MYDITGRLFYLGHMANDVYIYVEKCVGCRRYPRHLRRLLQLFPPDRLFELIVMDIFGCFPKTKNHNSSIVAITDQYLKLTRGIQTKKTTATYAASIVLDIQVMVYCISDHILTDIGPQFV